MSKPGKIELEEKRKIKSELLERDARSRASLKRLSLASSASMRRRNDLLPQLTLVERRVEELSVPGRNVRKREKTHVQQVANAITTLGFQVPLLIDEDNVIVDGAVRLEAAKIAGASSVPCIVVSALSPAERKLLRVAVNRLGEKGTWDFDDLKIELEELIIEDVPIEVSGFERAEIDSILMPGEETAEPGRIEPELGVPVSRVGDIYRLGQHRVICGDATDPAVVRRLMGDEVARFVFTDQPYNVRIVGNVTGGAHREFAMASGEMTSEQFLAFNKRWISAAEPHLVDGGLLATFIDWRHLSSVEQAALEAGLTQINLIVWTKTNAGMGSLYRSQHELLPLFKKGEEQHVNNVLLGKNGRARTNVWTYPGASSFGSDARGGLKHHPTVKPHKMLVDALNDVTGRGDIILDPFLGSGSTLVAAEKAGRICRGIELDPRYVDLILRRYVDVTKRVPVLEETGETFNALETRRKAEAEQAVRASQAVPASRAVPASVAEGVAAHSEPVPYRPITRERHRLRPTV